MTEVLVPVLIPYARFLEVRARRRQIVAELTPSTPEPPGTVAVSAPASNEQRADAAVRTVETPPTTAGIQR